MPAPSMATTKSTSWSLRWSVTRWPGDHEVAGLQLVDQRLVDVALGGAGESGVLGQGYGHADERATP